MLNLYKKKLNTDQKSNKYTVVRSLPSQRCNEFLLGHMLHLFQFFAVIRNLKERPIYRVI